MLMRIVALGVTGAVAGCTLAWLLISPQSARAAADGCSAIATRIEGQVTLDPACTYVQVKPIYITKSDTTLDCKGATLTSGKPLSKIVSIAPSDAPISNVTVKNCKIVNGGLGITAVRAEDVTPNLSPDQLRKRSPQNVRISNVTITDAPSVGLYVYSFVVGVAIDKVKIVNAASVCVYLDAYSQKTKITNSSFKACGDGPKPDGGNFNREAIAIDGSMYNTITGNTFDGDQAGGVFLYKNCWEHYKTSREGSFPRREPSSFNTIAGNIFVNLPIGVSVASRASKDQQGLECGDKSPYSGDMPAAQLMGDNGYPRYFLDPAPDNTISGNRFENVKSGVIVQDDSTTIRKNVFTDVDQYIKVGTPLRAKFLGKPVDKTTVSYNTTTDRDAKHFADKVAVTDGSTNTILRDNATDTESVALADGAQALEFDCSGDSNAGCGKTLACPAGQSIKAVKAGCDLETSKIDNASFDHVDLDTVEVLKTSDRVSDGACTLGGVTLGKGLSRISVPQGTSQIRMACREKDDNGGDCLIRATLICG